MSQISWLSAKVPLGVREETGDTCSWLIMPFRAHTQKERNTVITKQACAHTYTCPRYFFTVIQGPFFSDITRAHPLLSLVLALTSQESEWGRRMDAVGVTEREKIN